MRFWVIHVHTYMYIYSDPYTIYVWVLFQFAEGLTNLKTDKKGAGKQVIIYQLVLYMYQYMHQSDYC